MYCFSWIAVLCPFVEKYSSDEGKEHYIEHLQHQQGYTTNQRIEDRKKSHQDFYVVVPSCKRPPTSFKRSMSNFALSHRFRKPRSYNMYLGSQRTTADYLQSRTRFYHTFELHNVSDTWQPHTTHQVWDIHNWATMNARQARAISQKYTEVHATSRSVKYVVRGRCCNQSPYCLWLTYLDRLPDLSVSTLTAYKKYVQIIRKSKYLHD